MALPKVDPRAGDNALPVVGVEDHLIFVQRGTVAYTDEDTAITIAELPAGAQIIGFMVNVSTAFDAGTTNIMDIGDTSDADRFIVDLDVSSADMLLEPSLIETVLTADTTVVATFDGTGTAATAGAATITVWYLNSVA